MNFSQGSILLVPFPYTDQKSAKLRPALLISSENFNATTKDLWLTPISSQESNTPFKVSFGQRDLTEGTIYKNSFIKYGVVFTIEKSLILRKVAHLKKERLEEVLKAVKTILN